MKKKFLLFFLVLLCGVTFAGNRDQMRHWVVTNYVGLHGDWAAGNMTGFFNLMINGQIIQNSNYEVAGFIGDELIVSGSFPLVDQNYVYCFNLNGYDDPELSEDLNKIHFRIYDHANQMEIAGLSATFLVFELNVMVGSPDHPFAINFITGDTRWQKVTDASTLADGDLIIMTSPTDPEGFYGLSDEETSSGSGSNKIEGRGVVEVQDNNGILTWVILDEEDPLPQVMELYTSSLCGQGQFSLFAGYGFLYAAHNTKSQLKTAYDIKNANFVWSIDIEDGEAEVTAQGENGCKNLRYNDSKEIFSCFTNGQDPVCIYKLVQAPQTQQYTVTLAAQPTAAGTVEGAGTYDAGSSVTITATANTGYDFQYWLEGDNQITANPYTFTINGNVSYTAVFAEAGQPYTVTFDPGTGLCTTAQITETGVGTGIILPSAMPCTGASQAGYAFAGWATVSVTATSTAPTLYLADATYYPTEDCTLYAVYFSEGSGEMVLATSLAVGNTAYLVYEKNDVTAIIKKEFSSIYTGGSTHYGNVADYTTYPSLQPLTVGEGTAQNSLTFRTSDGKYLAWNSGNSLDVVDTLSSNCSWTVSFDNYEATVNNVATTSRVLSYNSGSPRFATYGNMSQKRVNFYVVADAIYNSNPSCDYLQPATTPVISGPTGVIYESTATVTISCETAGANIYYTTDGTVPTTASTVYTGPITIDETTTVKAIAGGEGFLESGVASTTFTFGNSFANIAAFKAAFTANSTEPCRIMSDITFVYKSGNNYYVQDETAALLVYDPNNYTTNTFNNGDVISGGIYGTHNLYNGMDELKLTQGLAAGVAGTPVQPTIATVAEINSAFADYESRLLKVVDVNFDNTYTINSTDKTAGIVQGENTMNVYNSFNNVNMTVDPLRHFDIIGFGAQFNNNKQLLPRDNNDIIPYYFVDLAEVEHGTIAADVAYCMPNTTVNLMATPDQHYSFGAWNVTDGTNVVEVANNSFNMPEADVTVSATFTANTYNVNVSILPNEESATVTITDGPYTYNMEVTANVTPAEGYTFIKWTIGNEVFTTPEITFNVVGDTELIAYLELTEYTVTATATEGGTATITPAGPYHLNDNVTITATSAEGYHFVNWTKGNEVFATEAQYSFAVTESMELVANFEENEVVYHTVTVVADPVNGGTVTGSGQVVDGESVTITARPAVGYEFVNFTYGETTVTTSEFTIEHVTTDLNVVAHFQLVEYTITILQGDGGAGSIYPEGPYHYNDTVTIEAYPIFGYVFVNWTKGNEVFATTETYTFAVTESCELQPNFAIVDYTINVTATEGGTATIAPAGPYHFFDNVTITATPDAGYQFVNWTCGDDVFATTAEYSFEVTGSLNLVAHFEQIEYTINVTATEGGEAEIDPEGPYHYNDEVMITATAATGYEFVNWTCGDDVFETTEIVSFNVTQSMNLVAHFAPVDYNITVTALEGGEAAINPAGPYHYSDSVTITATPAAGYQFVNWTWGDEVFATTAEYSFNVTVNMNLVANFELIPPTYYTVNVVADPVIGGTVTGAGQVLEGDSVTITATPALGYTFVNFTYGEVTVTTPQFTIEHVMSNLDITAHFEAIEYVVNVTAGEGGEVAIAPAGPYHYNDSVTITATPNAGYEFVRWTKGNEVFATTAVYTFIVTESMDLLANFIANEYTITVTATEGGEAAITPAGPYSYNDNVTITATPAEGYQFVNWTNGNEVFATTAEYSFNVTESLELVANFELIPPTYYTVSVVIDPANGGTVTGAGQVLEGGSVTLTATPATGYNFMNFAFGDTTILTPEITIENVMADITVTAHFVALQYVINVTAGEGGQAAISPAGPYHYNDSVTITATPDAGYEFVNWTNGNEVFATTADYTFGVTESMDLVAHFEPATYTVAVTATEGGEATITPAGPYSYNDQVTINATAAEGYQFVNWTNGNEVFATTAEYSFNVTESLELVANFELIEYTVNVTAAEGGEATITPAGPYHLNDNVTITATPAAGYQFVNWTVGTEVFATAAEYSFTVTENVTIVANFEQIEYTIAVTAGEGGEATITPAGPYHYNDNVTITAVAETGYYFVNWTNGTEVFAETATYSFAVTESLELVANFNVVPTSVTITATANPAEAGTITGAGEYDVNDTVTLTATAAVGYTFLNWTENDSVVATTATYEFMAETDRALVANFELNNYEITATVDPAEAGTVTGAGTYDHGATATMTATPAVGYHFVSWIENEFPVSLEATYSFTVTGARNLTAHFELNTVVVTTLANPVAGGMTEGDSTYVYGDQVTVTATANQYYEFVNWTVAGEEVSTELAYTFTATEDITLVANFEIEVFNITVLPCENGVILAPETAEVNSVVTVTSIAYPMYELTDLHYYTTDPEEVTEIDLTTLEFVMPEANITLVGQFELTEVAYDVNNDGLVNVLDVIAIIQYVAGNNPTPFIVDRADVNEDGEINIADALALNALIIGLKGDCEDYTAMYDVINGQLVIESPVALAGYQFTLSAEPTVLDMPGFSAIGNWKDGEYVLCLFNLSSEKEAGMYAVLDLNDGIVGSVIGATLQGCKVNMEKGTLSVNSFDEALYSVYPVPANTFVTVEGPSIEFVEVFNAMGQLVKVVNDIHANSSSISVNELSAGSYLFRIHANNGVAVKSVVVVK